MAFLASKGEEVDGTVLAQVDRRVEFTGHRGLQDQSMAEGVPASASGRGRVSSVTVV